MEYRGPGLRNVGTSSKRVSEVYRVERRAGEERRRIDTSCGKVEEP